MSNVFAQTRSFNEKSKRNNFDLSFQNHLTMKFGTLYPVFCKEVLPGDSFKIDTAMGLKFMPMVFPVQSQMRATMHFFYCRNKNLWKNWDNWLMNLEEHTHPYISQSPSFFKTGSLADYLDIPTTLVSSTGKRVDLHPNTHNNISINEDGNLAYSDIAWIQPRWIDGMFQNTRSTYGEFVNTFISAASDHYLGYPLGHPIDAPFDTEAPYLFITGLNLDAFNVAEGTRNQIGVAFLHGTGDIHDAVVLHGALCNVVYQDVNHIKVELEHYNFTEVNHAIEIGEKVYLILYIGSDVRSFPSYPHATLSPNPVGKDFIFSGVSADLLVSQPLDLSSTGMDVYRNAIHLNALPFRAYESIYQAFYRNTQNQDFIIDGQPVYNRYNTTLEDGADTTDYHLYQRNYEMDFLTGSYPSPQQGNAPVIGISALGNITLEDESGITTARAEVGEDGDTITGVVVTSPVASQGHRVALAELASAGFTISSFREGNALTRWLEMNMRKGYRYIDFIEGHHGVRPQYKELDMPEFIGGFSRDVTVNSILNQTSSPDSDPLGSFAGTANCFAGSSHSINHFCDDYGWIIGILCVTPTPSYSQLLPKHYLKNSPLDYYFKEFSELGMQPITYEEVCPVQAYSEQLEDPEKSIRDVFGYQRPNYDLVAFTDQVHGNFRTDLRNFLINRVFGSRPELGNEFLQINPEEVNDIFAVTTPSSDVIAGQIVFRVHAKRPIPRVSIPSLGR